LIYIDIYIQFSMYLHFLRCNFCFSFLFIILCAIHLSAHAIMYH